MKYLPKIFLLFLALTFIHPRVIADPVQTEAFSDSNGICVYSLDALNRYTCDLHNAIISAPNQILTIAGTHLPGRGNADVLVVVHRNTTINFFNGEILRTFPNLVVIDMQNVRLTSIADGAFALNCDQLQELNINSNFLTSLPNQLFQNCQNLQILRASQNHLFSLPAELFGRTSNLRVFEMQNNQLESFPQALLINMTSLSIFNVQRNNLRALSVMNFQNNNQLEELDVSFNRLSSIFDLITSQINLLRLRINSNQIFNLNFAIIVRFQNLQVLNVDAQQGVLSVLLESLPASLTDLSINWISMILPQNPFTLVPNLVHLTISGTGIWQLNEMTFQSMTRLETLSITNTNLNSLSSQLFRSLTNLKTLVLNNASFRTLPEGIFATLSNLEILSINSNFLEALRIDSFGQHPQLKSISFRFNMISQIQRGLFALFSPNMQTVDISGNFCVDRIFENITNLDQNEDLSRCFSNFENSNPTTVAPTTLGSGITFKRTEILGIIVIGIVGCLWNLMK